VKTKGLKISPYTITKSLIYSEFDNQVKMDRYFAEIVVFLLQIVVFF